MKNVILILIGIFVAGLAAYASPKEIKTFKDHWKPEKSVCSSFDYVAVHQVAMTHDVSFNVPENPPVMLKVILFEENKINLFNMINGYRPKYLSRSNLSFYRACHLNEKVIFKC